VEHQALAKMPKFVPIMNQRSLFLRHVAQTSPAPLALSFVKAEGCILWDEEGRPFIDLISGISVCNVGHRHPRVVRAIHDQTDRYLHLLVYGELVETPQVALATRLASLLPGSLDTVYFTSSGSEATEGAMKLAKRVTGRADIVAFKDSYHGSTQGALSIMGDEYWRNAFRPLLPGIQHLSYGSMEDLAQITDRTACVVAETVQAEAGVNKPSVEWMKALRSRCDETGTMLVLDEIQAGFGRTGPLWAFEAYGIIPDILLLGQALGGGMPLGAFVSSQANMLQFTNAPVLGHITTFGGHPVCCAAGLAGLEALLEEGHLKEVARKSDLFASQLRHPLIRKVNRSGLLMAAEFDGFDQNKRIIDRCIEKGLLTDWFLFAPHCMRIAPPLTISDEEIIEACRIVLEACDDEVKG
jgi:acetylornithine/succinyldiaminopimelate/putrescine aminotransferase